MKKILLLVVFALLFSACGRRNDAVVMDQPKDDGNYYYSNKDLGFSLTLPKEFIYYQTQRKQNEQYVDIEFFVPTSDKKAAAEVPGYAKPIVIRIYGGDNRNENIKNDPFLESSEVIGEENDKTYIIRFWGLIPADWQEKWTEDIKVKIKNGFKIE